jgi:hypothetical protein
MSALCGGKLHLQLSAESCAILEGANPLAIFCYGSCCQCSYVWRDGQYWQVPASRADVFKDASLKPPEKRLLMRFLQKLQQYATQDGSKV